MRFGRSHPLSVLSRTVAIGVLMLDLGSFSQAAEANDASIAHVPAPSGPYAIGTMSIRLVDGARSDPFLRNGSKRELMVRFWYPAPRSGTCAPAKYSAPKVQSYLASLGWPALEIRTNSCQQAPVMPGAHPVVVASHGYTGL